MGKMVLIGGGIFSETTPFLQEAINLSEKETPKVLVIPTAGKDSEKAYGFWREQFEMLGGKSSPLYLIEHPPDRGQLEERILSADVVYVPGGDTHFMVRLWRKLGVDKVLKKAFRQGVVLSGRSAGAACWFRHAVTGEPPSKGARFYSYRRVVGVGLIDVALCAHYQDRREPFKVFLQQFGGIGLGLEDYQAVVIYEDIYRLVSLKEAGPVYKVHVENQLLDNFTVPTLCEEALSETGSLSQLTTI